MKKVISAMLVIGMMCWLSACATAEAGSVADIYNVEKLQCNYYSKYTMSDYTEEIEGDILSGNYQDLDGMVALWFYEAEGGFPIDITYSMKVSSGKAKLIRYYTDGTSTRIDVIDQITNYNTVGETYTSTIMLEEGLSCIKVVGTDKADVEITLKMKNMEHSYFIGANH